MPSPVGHSLMGYILYRATARAHEPSRWTILALCLFAANAPDLDFLPGLVAGEISRYHHGPSHSFVFAVLFGILAATLFRKRLNAFLLGSALYLSHVLLDYLIKDPSPPLGVPLFWPFSNEYYMSPLTVYRPFNYPATFAEPLVSTLVSLHNVLTVLLELVFLMPVLLFVCWYKSCLSQRNS